MEYNLDGADQPATRLVKLRNPWAKDNWIGAYSEDSAEYAKLKAYYTANGMELKSEGGKFFMPWTDFKSRIDTVDICYGQESKLTD